MGFLPTKHISLHAACRLGNMYKVNKRLQEDASRIDEPDPDNPVDAKTPLFLAVEFNHEDIVRFLLMKGARPDVTCTADKITPLEKARLKKNQKLIDILARLERATEASSSLAETAHKFTPPAPKDIKAVVEANGQAAITKVYYLAVVTGNIEGCGVDANVMVTLCGEQAMSGVVMLQNSDDLKLFRPGQTDIFCLKLPDLGALTHIRIGHDGSADRGSWYLEKVIVTEDDMVGGERATEFYAGRWLAVDKEDGQVECVLQGELWV